MGLQERIALYREMEGLRQRPLLVYVTSSRRNAEAQIAADVISEIMAQLVVLPTTSEGLDLLLVSNGGDGTVAWRVVSLIREKVKKFSVLVPQAAFSAATLIALGADEIVMHPHGNLGPTDPQIMNKSKNVQFGAQDLAAFLKFAREEVGLTDQAPMLDLFRKFSEEVGFVGIGVAARSTQLTTSMADKLLRLHMTSDNQSQKAKVISETLNSKYFHHGYPVSRSEAKDIGLPVADEDPKVASLMWRIWLDIESELRLREPFSPVRVLRDSPLGPALFGSVGSPQQTANPGAPLVLQPIPYSVVTALVESERHATRHVVDGEIIGLRGPDMKLNVNMIPISEGWRDMAIPPVAVPAAPAQAPANAEPAKAKGKKSNGQVAPLADAK